MCIDDTAEVLMCIEDTIGSGGQRTEEEERKVRLTRVMCVYVCVCVCVCVSSMNEAHNLLRCDRGKQG